MAETPRYYRLSPKFWSDPMVLGWDDDTRLLALYLLTCPHRTTEGLFRLPRLYAMADLGWDAERFDQGFKQLQSDGFIEWDQHAQVVLIVKALVWQSPDNGNMVKSAVRQLAMVPETPLKARFKTLAEQYCERLAEGLPEGFGEGSGEHIGDPQALSLPQAPPPETEPNGSGGKPSVTEIDGFDFPFPIRPDDVPLYQRLRTWATSSGFTRPEDRSPSVQWQWLMGIVGEVLGDGKYSHGVRVSLCGEFVEHITDDTPEHDAWQHLRQLVKLHGGPQTLEWLGEACRWGAGKGKWADDPLGLTRYVAGIASKGAA